MLLTPPEIAAVTPWSQAAVRANCANGTITHCHQCGSHWTVEVDKEWPEFDWAGMWPVIEERRARKSGAHPRARGKACAAGA